MKRWIKNLFLNLCYMIGLNRFIYNRGWDDCLHILSMRIDDDSITANEIREMIEDMKR